MFVIKHSILLDDKQGKVTSLFLTAINLFKFDSNTRCSLVRCTSGKSVIGVISLLSLSIPNVFLRNAVLCPIGVFAFLIALWYQVNAILFSLVFMLCWKQIQCFCN